MQGLDQILDELARGLRDIYGPRLIALYLYGSRARGDADEDSDIDVAMVLEDCETADLERERFSRFRAELCLRHGVVISLTPVSWSAWRRALGPFLRNVQREGRRVA